MKKTMKQILAIILVVVMTIGAAPLSGFVGLKLPDWLDFSKLFTVEAEAATCSGTCGENLTWTLDRSTGVLEISGTGAMNNYSDSSSTRAPWYSYRSYIKTVKIGNGVTSIGNFAFADCESLTSITIPDSVTSIGYNAFYNTSYYSNANNWENDVLYIGKYLIKAKNTISGSYSIKEGTLAIADDAFRFCDITSITIPDSVTSIGEEAFYSCDSLTSITIPDSVTSIGDSAFSNCDSLTSITVDENNKNYSSDASGVLFDKNKTKLIQYLIGNTRKSYEIPDTVTSIGDDAFCYCDSLTSITIPDSVTSIGDAAFYECTSLTSITIPDSVTSIGDSAFSNCDSLTSITIPDSVTSIGDAAFFRCYNLTSITIPDTVTSIGDAAFCYCDSLTSITIPDSVTSIGDAAFYYCRSLTSITVDKNNKNYSSDPSGVLFNKNKMQLIQYPIGNTRTNYVIPDSVTSIGEEAFFSCDSLTSVTIPDSVTSIGESAFYSCDSLTSVIIPDSVKSIGVSAFNDCASLTSVIIPDSVKSIGSSAFRDCFSLTSITIPNSVTSIGGCAFYHCFRLTSITIPDSVTSIGDYAFDNCDSLADVYYSGTEAEWNAISIGSFNGDLTNATIHYNYVVKDKTVVTVKSDEYVIFVYDVLGIPVEGALVTWNSDSSYTDDNGKAIFVRGTNGQPLITVEKKGYLKYTNENINYSKSSKGYEFITLYEDTSAKKLKLKSAKYSFGEEDSWFGNLLTTTKIVSLRHVSKFSIHCVANDTASAVKYELYQNDNLIKTSTNGVFKDLLTSEFKKGGGVKVRVYSDNTNYVDSPLNLVFDSDKVNDGTGFTIGNKIEFAVDDDIPFIGGSTLKMDFPVFPIDISVNENDDGETTVHVAVNADIYGAEKDEKSGNWTKEEKESFKEKQQSKIKDLQNALSTMESWYLRSTNPNDKSLKEIKNLCADVSKPEIPGLNKVNVSFLGYGEGVWNSDSEFSEIKVNAYLIVEATVVDRTFQHFAPIGPFVIPIVFNITVKGEGKVGAEFSYEVDTRTFNGDFKLMLSAGLNMFGGVGIGKAVGVGAYGNATLDTEIQLVGTTNNTGLNSVNLTGEAGFKAYLAIWSYEKPWAHRTWNLYTRNQKPKNLSTQSLPADNCSVYDAGMYTLQDLSYLSGESEWLGENVLYTSAITVGGVNTLISNTYRDSRPMIVSAGDTMVMVYTGSDTSRTAYNHTRVMYSVYNSTNNSWSTPKQLDSNNTLDMAPYLYSDGTNIYVVYSDATRTFSESDDMKTILTSQNIAVSKFDFANKMFANPEVIVTADGNYNSVPVIATVNGTPAVLYQSNASADVFGTSSENSIIKVSLDGSKEIIAENLNSIVGYAIGDKGIAYIIDGDNVLSTCDDRLLYLNGDFVEAGVVSNPQFANNGKLYWYSNGTVKEYGNGINEIYPEGIIGFTDSFKVLNNKIVYLSATGADISDIMQLSCENGVWSSPVQLTKQDKIIDTFSATEFDGEIITVMTRRDVTITETEVIDECEIAWTVIEDRYDLSVDYVDYEHDDIKPDTNLNITAGISNKGTTEIKNVDVKITNSTGDVVYSEIQNVLIKPSENYDLTASISIGETVTFDEYTVTVTEVGANDSDISNNQCKASVGYSKFDVSANSLIFGENRKLIVSVKNSGYTSSGGKLNVYRFDDKSTPVETRKIGGLNLGEQEICMIDITEDLLGGKAGKLYIEFVPDVEQFNIFSNKADAYFELCNHDNVGEWEIKTNATCTEDGEKVKRCVDCSVAVEFEVIPSVGHGETETVIIAATCTEAGKTYETCLVCGEIIGDITETTSEGHKPGQWQTITEANVYHEGYEVLNCEICNELIDEKINPKLAYFTVQWIAEGVTVSQTYISGERINIPQEPQKTGYVFTGWTPAVPETMPRENLTFTATWSANSYDAVFNANGGAWSDGETSKTISTEYDSLIVPPVVPTKQGYLFSRWSPDVGVMDSVDGKTFIAEWIPAADTRYTVETYTMNTVGEYEKSTQVFSGITGETATAESVVPTGLSLNSAKSVLSGTIAADNSLVLKIYLDRNTYIFTTVVDGVPTETEYYYGSTISELAEPEKAGYKFVGWDKVIPSTMPAENVTVTAKFETIVSVKIKNNTGSKSVNYGEVLRLTAIATNKPADANIVWFVDGVKQGEGETFNVSFESGTKTVEVKLVDSNGNVLKDSSGNEIKDTEKVSVNSSFWQKIVSFFKNLFGMNRTVVQTIFKNVF